MIAPLLLLLAQADPNAMMARSSALTARVTAAPARDPSARWRVESDADTGPDAKTRAAQTTGTPCGVVGARLCTKKPRTWLRAPISQ